MRASAGGDGGARRRIVEDLGTDIVVVAGAGTGKTTALVGRIVELVRTGAAPLSQIAAITFTDAAAAELSEHVRRALDAAAAADPGNPHLATAVDDVDDAAICTLHAFARRILVEHCVAARLPPGFAVLDDTADRADFEARWARFVDALVQDPAAEPAFVLGFSLGLRPTDLSDIAWNLHAHWDRLEDGGLAFLRGAGTCDGRWPSTDVGPVLAALDRALALTPWCTDNRDNMAVHLRGTVTGARSLLSDARGDTEAVLQLLLTLPPLRHPYGKQENWSGRVAEVRSACTEADRARHDLLDAVRRAVLGDLVARVAEFILATADARRVEGRITFHDLLVHARRLLRSGGDATTALRRRYRRLLIDEVQDTDPIQVELAARLAAAGDDGAADVDATRPGALFVVGDPEQSIYRFRRADIDLFERVRADIGSTVLLDTNFRSVPGIIDFVNAVCREVFGEGSGPGLAAHHDLHGARAAAPAGPEHGSRAGRNGSHTGGGGGGGERFRQLSFEGIGQSAAAGAFDGDGDGQAPDRSPPVVIVGGPLDESLPEVRRRAARGAAAAIDRIVDGGRLVEDQHDRSWRPARRGDVAVLIPTRATLAALEEEFAAAGVAYRLEGAALLWAAEEVGDVLAVLHAADDPADHLAVVAALRSTGLGCGDDDLVTWHRAGGTWDPRAAAPPGLDTHPVALAMTSIDQLHRRRWWSEPSAMVAAACSELRSFELALAHARPRDHWNRLRWLMDQARLFDETAGGTLREFLVWARLRGGEDGRVGATGPPDPDDDAVRVMTIHGAKGLEFPVVVLAGLERAPSDGWRPPAVLWTEDDVPEVRAGDFRTLGYEQAGLREQELDALERRRLLYVAMTRARDHLVLCLHHKVRTGGPDSSLAALVTRICAGNPALWRRLPVDDAGLDMPPTQSATPEATALPPQWEADRTRLLAELRRRPVATATAMAAHGGHAPPRSGTGRSIPSPDPGRTGSPGARAHAPLARRVGRAVHATLAQVDLATGRDPAGRPADEVARALALVHGVAAHGGDVSTMVDSALTSPVVQRAGTRRHWREVYVATPVAAGGVLEGFVDLLFEDDDGLVVVDYKTHAPDGSTDVADIAAYRQQVAAYALALEASTGRPVVRCVLLFIGHARPVELVVDGHDLDAARMEARRVAEIIVTGDRADSALERSR